jgi:hypothetical protein
LLLLLSAIPFFFFLRLVSLPQSGDAISFTLGGGGRLCIETCVREVDLTLWATLAVALAAPMLVFKYSRNGRRAHLIAAALTTAFAWLPATLGLVAHYARVHDLRHALIEAELNLGLRFIAFALIGAAVWSIGQRAGGARPN